MSQNRTSFFVPKFFHPHYTPLVKFTHERSTTKELSNGIRSSWTPTPKLNEELTSMASFEPPGTSLGVLLPVCLLAVFLSCVVCVYHWQSVRERRMDLEDERKRKRLMYDSDGGCALKSYRNKSKVRMYPWKTVRIQELPDVNNNVGFHIPTTPGVDKGTESYYSKGGTGKTVTLTDPSGEYDRTDLNRSPIYLSASSYSSEADVNLKYPSSRSADSSTKSCAVASSSKKSTELNDEVKCDFIREEAIHVTHFDVDGQVVCVETLNGSLLEYWV